MHSGYKYSRYAHSEGHTCVCYTHSGEYLITCGSDCDVRLWRSNVVEDDDSPSSMTLREPATAIVECNGVVYVGSGNYVEAYKYPDLKYSERPLRFTATVTDVDISADGKILAAGACDMKIQLKNMVTEEIMELTSHTAPILRVVLSLDLKFLASSSCDGSVRVWDTSTSKTLKTFNNVLPAVNDFVSAISLGSPAWFEKSHLVTIMDKKVCFHTVNNWSLAYELSSTIIKKSISVISIAQDRLLLCAGTTIGEIIVWKLEDRTVVKYLEDSDKVAITSMSWSPVNTEFACCDRFGRVRITSAEKTDDVHDNVEEKSDEVENIAEKEDDENVISIGDIKASLRLSHSEGLDNENEDDVSESDAGYPVKSTFEIDIQPAFQPSSTPSHFEHGYMVWNAIGIVRSFNSDVDSSIDVEFHDTMLHHSIHRRNHSDYVMAALSCRVLCLASTSMLTCINLNAWDEKKEWSVNMPDDESIKAIASSGDWVCCATSLNQLRFFGCTGMQRQLVSLPGPVVCIGGHERLFIVITHLGPGLPGCQNLGYMIFEITDFFIRAITTCQPLPVTPESKLKWAGFTDEGTPCTYDSAGILRLSRDFYHWEVVCNTRQHRSNASDNYFVIGMSERLQCVRCILCRGSWYPMTLPRPTVVEIPLKIPLCNPDESKTGLEDVFWRHVFSLPVLEEPSRENDDYRVALNDWEKLLKQTIIKLFAEAYRNRADMRAVFLASLMSEQPLEMAMKLVQGEGRMYLADKLHNIEPKDWNDLKQGPTNITNIANYVGIVSNHVEGYTHKEIKNKYSHKSQGDMFELSQPSTSTGSGLLISSREKDSSQSEKSNPSKLPATANVNPFKVLNKEDHKPKGLSFFNNVKQTSLKPPKAEIPITEKASKGKLTNPSKDKANTTTKMKFFEWFKIEKLSLQEQFPELSMSELTKEAMKLYRKEVGGAKQKNREESAENSDENKDQSPKSKRPKMDDDNNKVKASISEKLREYNFN